MPDDEVVHDKFSVRGRFRTNCTSGPQETNELAAQKVSCPSHGLSETCQTPETAVSSTSNVIATGQSGISAKESVGMDAQRAFLSNIKHATKPLGLSPWNNEKKQVKRRRNSGLAHRMQQIMNTERTALENFKSMDAAKRQGLIVVFLWVR